MKTFDATLRSLTPYSQGRHHNTPRLPKELDAAYEQRTVLEKLHVHNGEIYIPPMAFKLALTSTAGYLSEQIPGKGRETYTKHYKRGVICPDPVMTGVTPEKVRIDSQFIPSQPGRPKSGRVWKSFPILDEWAGVLRIVCVDDIFTLDVIARHLQLAGILTGIGVWRTENEGLQGKFLVEDLIERKEV